MSAAANRAALRARASTTPPARRPPPAHPAAAPSLGSFAGAAVAPRARAAPRPAAAPLAVSARYRGHGTDLSKVDAFKAHAEDSGSAAFQVARMSARVLQLTAHLQKHKKDYSTRRGLMAILAQRKQMLLYLQRTDRPGYERALAELSIRPLKAEAAR